jgi:hypothetical protein
MPPHCKKCKHCGLHQHHYAKKYHHEEKIVTKHKGKKSVILPLHSRESEESIGLEFVKPVQNLNIHLHYHIHNHIIS